MFLVSHGLNTIWGISTLTTLNSGGNTEYLHFLGTCTCIKGSIWGHSISSNTKHWLLAIQTLFYYIHLYINIILFRSCCAGCKCVFGWDCGGKCDCHLRQSCNLAGLLTVLLLLAVMPFITSGKDIMFLAPAFHSSAVASMLVINLWLLWRQGWSSWLQYKIMLCETNVNVQNVFLLFMQKTNKNII